jgi:hypothetical protein
MALQAVKLLAQYMGGRIGKVRAAAGTCDTSVCSVRTRRIMPYVVVVVNIKCCISCVVVQSGYSDPCMSTHEPAQSVAAAVHSRSGRPCACYGCFKLLLLLLLSVQDAALEAVGGWMSDPICNSNCLH